MPPESGSTRLLRRSCSWAKASNSATRSSMTFLGSPK